MTLVKNTKVKAKQSLSIPPVPNTPIMLGDLKNAEKIFQNKIFGLIHQTLII